MGSRSTRAVTRATASIALLAIALSSALYLARARYPLGLDVEGGAHATFEVRGDLDAAVERVRRIVADSGESNVDVRHHGGWITAWASDATEAELAPVLATIARPGRIRFHEVAEPSASGDYGEVRHVRTSRGEELSIHKPAVLTDRDVARVVVYPGPPPEVGMEFTPHGARRLAEVTQQLRGRRLALLIGDELVMAPEVREPITRGQLAISHAGDPVVLAERLRTAIGPELELQHASFIEAAYPAWLGRPLAIILGIAALLAWLLTVITRNTLAGIVATFVAGWALALVALLAPGGTLTLACHVTGAIAGGVAALAAALATRASDDTAGSRLGAAWPAGGVLLAMAIASAALATANWLPYSTLGFGIKFLVRALPFTAVLALLVTFAVPLRAASR
jgi:preprotein translocase subunit SecD